MRTKLTVFVSAALMSVVLAVYGQTTTQQPAASPEGATAQRAALDKYCVRCHNQRAKNGITLDSLDLAHVTDKAELWEKAVRKLRAGMMPPSGEARPDPATFEALTAWLENELDRNTVRQLPPPGLHRLNRTEYTNVIRC
jgi:mono/diheme cytochrome c family protein